MPKTLAQIAVDAGLLSRADVGRAEQLADERRVPLVVALIRELGVDEVALVGAFRRELRMLSVDPRAVKPETDALREVSIDLCKRLRVVPLRVSGPPEDDKEIWLAMADPTDMGAIAEVERTTGAIVDPALLPLSAIDELIERGYKELNTQVLKRAKGVFGANVVASTRPHARVGGEGDETARSPAHRAVSPARRRGRRRDPGHRPGQGAHRQGRHQRRRLRAGDPRAVAYPRRLVGDRPEAGQAATGSRTPATGNRRVGGGTLVAEPPRMRWYRDGDDARRDRAGGPRFDAAAHAAGVLPDVDLGVFEDERVELMYGQM